MAIPRKCSRCGANLSRYNLGKLCSLCQEKVKAELEWAREESLHYDLEDMCRLLGFQSNESVKRLARKGLIPGRVPGVKKHLFLREEVDLWLRTGATASKAEEARENAFSYQPVQMNEEEAPAFCLVSHISKTDEVYGTLAHEELHILRAVALIDNKEVPIVFDWERGYWRKE